MKRSMIVYLLSAVCFVNSYKILGLFPYKGKSHFNSFEPLLTALAAKGHDVTVVSHFPKKPALANYHDIDISAKEGVLEDVVNFNDLPSGRLFKYLTPVLLTYIGYESCYQELAHPKIINFVKSKPKFDVILTEYFSSPCFLGIVHQLQAPFIGMTSAIPFSWQADILGFSSHPAFAPNHFLPFSDKMAFLERVENTVVYVFHNALYSLLMEPINNRAARKYLGQDLPPASEIVLNTSLVLINNHFTYTIPRLTVPGYIEIGGMHIKSPKKVPQDIEKWITESPHGVIYFSLGSMIKGHTFPEEKRQMFLNAFARLPQRVLWKWETEMPGQPKNVMIGKWMPQFDILNHPNVKAFISHGGLLGTTESVHCGVPMLVMPQFGDQFANARAIEASGGGIMLDFTSLSEDLIYNSLKTVLHPDFNKKAKELSERFRDRPLPPLDTAVYWVEYVARHKGAPHMRTAAVGMPFYQYLLLDVIAFLTVILFVLFYIFYFVTKALFRKLFKSKSVPEKVKKQ